MKLVHVSFQVQYTDLVEEVLARQGLRAWARYGRVAGRDCDGRHEGSQAFPGNLTVIQAQVPDARVDAVLDALEEFRGAKRSHRHLEALVLPVERKIGAIRESGDALECGDDEEEGGGAPARGAQGAVALVLALLLPVLAGCSARPWTELTQGGPPEPRPLELPEPPELRPAEAPVEAGAEGGVETEGETGDAAGGEAESESGAAEVPTAREAGPPAAGPAETLALSRDAALVTALLNNPGLEVARFGPRIAGMAVPEALAAFDPRLSGSLFYEDDTRQLTAVQSFTFRDDGDGGQTPQPARPFFLDRQTLNVATSLSTLFPGGTGLVFDGVVDRSDTNFTPREYEGSWNVQVTQPLMEGRGREVNLIALRQAENRAVQSAWQVRRSVLDLVAGVERAYWDLVLAQEVVGIREFGVRLAEEQLELNQDLVDTGRAVRSAVLSARAERASRRADLEDARGRVRSLSVGLLRLLNPSARGRIDGNTAVEAVEAPRVERVEVDVEASVREALERRPEVFRDRIETLNRRLDVVAAEDALQPELDLVAGYGRTSLGLELGDGLDHLVDDSRFDHYRLALELDLPLIGRGELARYRSARLSEMRSEAILQDTALAVDEEVRRAAVDVETQWLRIEATEEAVASREEELRIERDRYEVGMARNLDVLQVQRLLIEAQVDAVTAKVRYLQALTDLDRAEGTLLEKRGITLAGIRPDPDALPAGTPPLD